MIKINLRDYYPCYESDQYVDIPDEVADLIDNFERREANYIRRLFRYKAQYSLNQGDGIEKSITALLSNTPSKDVEDEYEDNLTRKQLYMAIDSLPERQAKRIYAHFFLGMSKTDIARAEGVNEGNIRKAINRGLENIKKYFENLQKEGTNLS